jgi:hypothetical protein
VLGRVTVSRHVRSGLPFIRTRQWTLVRYVSDRIIWHCPCRPPCLWSLYCHFTEMEPPRIAWGIKRRTLAPPFVPIFNLCLTQPPPYFLSTHCDMSAPIEATHGNLALTSSITKLMLAGSGGILAVSCRFAKAHSSLLMTDPVLFLFGMGTFLHLAYRRKVERESSLEDGRVQPSPPRVRPSTKVSFPASGVYRSRAYYVRQEDASSSKSAPSSSMQIPTPGNPAHCSGSGLVIDQK